MIDVSTLEAGIALLALHGDGPVSTARRSVRDALIDVQRAGHRRVLVDAREATGLGHPSVIERVDTVREWASVAVPGLSIAFVAHADFLDEDRIGMVVASQLGLNAHVCTTREEAVAWLARQRLFLSAPADAGAFATASD